MKPQFETGFTKMLGIEFPLLVAPMFLISNSSMVVAALEAGVTAAIPALNYRTDNALREAIREIRQQTDKPFGFNLIVNKSNPSYKKQLDTLCELRVDYIITSLGSPEAVIKRCKPLGIKVFCDVVNLEYAKKVEALGADALIAVGREAGGHCGPWPNKVLLVALEKVPILESCWIWVLWGFRWVQFLSPRQKLRYQRNTSRPWSNTAQKTSCSAASFQGVRSL